MLKTEHAAPIVDLLNDLEIDLRNGNVPAAKLLIVSIVNFLPKQQPLDWRDLGNFIIDHLDETDSRISLLQLVPVVKELICPFQPEQEVKPQC